MDVTLEDLRKYRDRKLYVKVLQEDIQRILLSSPAPAEVKGGKSSVHTPSDPTKEKALKLVERRERLERVLVILEEQTERVERFTLEIDDPLVAAAIRLHFLDGCSWGRTSIRLYGNDGQKDTIRMAVFRYMEARERNDNEETDTGGRIQGAEGE